MMHTCSRFFDRLDFLLPILILLGGIHAQGTAWGQDASSEIIREAARRTGLSEQEVMEYMAGKQGTMTGSQGATAPEPGRTNLEGIDDSLIDEVPGQEEPFRDFRESVFLPFDAFPASAVLDTAVLDSILFAVDEELDYFGKDFFSLDQGVFSPPSFGPIPDDHRLGVGDEVIVNAWGAIEFQETRVVDRDGSIILPKGGKIQCVGRTLEQIQKEVRRALSRSHSTIDTGEGGDTTVEVLLGRLRSIRVFVVGAVQRPGSYEVSSLARILTALYAAGGPTAEGSMRMIRLVRDAKVVAEMDLYTYLLEGKRLDDALLREGDTIFVPDIGPRVHIGGEVKRPLYYEMKVGQTLSDLLQFCGGFTAEAVCDLVHIKRIIPTEERMPGRSDYTYLDVAFQPEGMRPVKGSVPLFDGDKIVVARIQDREADFVDITGMVKRPGRFQWSKDLTVSDILHMAGGLLPEALREQAVIDRTDFDGKFTQLSVSLLAENLNTQAPVLLQARDHLQVFSRWENTERPEVVISGEVHEPQAFVYREGMTLRDLVLKAGGLRREADLLRAEVARLDSRARSSRDLTMRPDATVDVTIVEMGPEFLTQEDSYLLQPWDRIYIRSLPWWEGQETVEIEGEVFYPGTFSLIRKDERISSLVQRAGGVKPDAYLLGGRVVREENGVGNIAIDLSQALSQPGSDQDIILYGGDKLFIPNRMFTVKVVGEVGFPTSLVFKEGLNIDDYVNLAGGYLEMADKGKARVVWPNGMSLPNEGDSAVKAGSTIIVPVKPPDDRRDPWETIRDITSIVASLATVWVVVNN